MSPMANVAPFTDMLKGASLGATGLGLFVSTWSAASDPTSFAYRYWRRYTASFERKLRPMFIFTPGRKIVIGQCIAAFLLVTAQILIDIPFWFVGLGFIAVLPAVYVEHMRRQRVEALEKQLDMFMLALANALKSTPSIGAAFGSVSTGIQNPMKQEVELALKEMKVGSSLDQALLHMAARVGSRQLDSALSSILIGRQV